MLNQFPAVCFQLSTSAVACAGGRPAAASDARPVATTEMNALQLHQVIKATTAIKRPLIVMARYCGVKSSAIRGGAAWLAAFFHRSGSFTNKSHQERNGCRQQAEEEHIAPGHFRVVDEVHALHLIRDDGRQKQPDRCGGVQEGARFDAAVFGNDLGHHGRTGRPLAADPERRDDAEEHERRHVRCERTCRRSDRIHHHRQQQRARPAEPIGDTTENDASDGPANQQQRCQDSGPMKRRGSSRSSAERNIEQHRHRIRRDVVEEQAVENVEAPSQPGGKQHRPLVGVHIEQCSSGRGRHRLHVTALSGLSLDHERSPFRGDWAIRASPMFYWSEPKDSNTLCSDDKGSS